MIELQLEQLKQIELDILKSFHQYCTKHNLRYFLTGGTLLGAVRHKGFIPWDDDIDVCMPRVDYEKFIANFPKDPLNKNFQMASVETMSGYYLPFAKLMRRGTFLKETVDTDLPLGVYMDIFPLDNMSDNYDTAYKLFCSTSYWRKMLLLKNISISSNRSLWKNLILLLGKIALCWLPRVCILKTLIKKARIYENEQLSRFVCAVVMGTYGIKEILQGEWYSQAVLIPFEDSSFLAPKGYRQILEHFYGNYMQLPPKEKQKTHHSFEAYQFLEEK